jgi:hypothetical protein
MGLWILTGVEFFVSRRHCLWDSALEPTRTASLGVRMLLCTVIFGAASARAAAADFACAQVQPSEIFRPAYAQIGHTKVCEGFYDKAVARAFMELVSLTTERLDAIAAQNKDQLLVSTDSARQGTLNLLIQPLSVAKPYRVDAVLSAPGPLEWNSRQMRAACNLTLTEVGYLAAVTSSTGSELRVAAVRVTSVPAAGADLATSAYAIVRVSEDAAQFKWRSYPVLHPSGPIAWTAVSNGHLYADEWATVQIPLAKDGGDTVVELSAVDATGTPFKPLRFSIMGPAHVSH